jgi:F-type H+-transporting ATPase subunit alpha
VGDVRRFESELVAYLRSTHGALLEEIKLTGLPESLGDAITAFKAQFQPTAGAATAIDPTKTAADELGDAQSRKTLATE